MSPYKRASVHHHFGYNSAVRLERKRKKAWNSTGINGGQDKVILHKALILNISDILIQSSALSDRRANPKYSQRKKNPFAKESVIILCLPNTMTNQESTVQINPIRIHQSDVELHTLGDARLDPRFITTRTSTVLHFYNKSHQTGNLAGVRLDRTSGDKDQAFRQCSFFFHGFYPNIHVLEASNKFSYKKV